MKLAHISFSRPIPIPGTHERISEFSAGDGWDIVDDDGRTWLSREGNSALGRPPVRFYTYVNGSCLPAEDRASQDRPSHALDVDKGASVSPAPTPTAKKGRKR